MEIDETTRSHSHMHSPAGRLLVGPATSHLIESFARFSADIKPVQGQSLKTSQVGEGLASVSDVALQQENFNAGVGILGEYPDWRGS